MWSHKHLFSWCKNKTEETWKSNTEWVTAWSNTTVTTPNFSTAYACICEHGWTRWWHQKQTGELASERSFVQWRLLTFEFLQTMASRMLSVLQCWFRLACIKWPLDGDRSTTIQLINCLFVSIRIQNRGIFIICPCNVYMSTKNLNPYQFDQLFAFELIEVV